MYADIEALVLGTGPSHDDPEGPRQGESRDAYGSDAQSHEHTNTADPGWHDDEFLAAEKQRYEAQGLDYDSDTARREAIRNQFRKETEQKESIGMGPGRTGVKGVIRDQKEHDGMMRAKRAKEAEEMRKAMEKTSLGGKTYLEEEKEKAMRGQKADDLVMKELERNAATGLDSRSGDHRRDVLGFRKDGKFGHLREVDKRNFVNAIDNEDKNTWVVVHLYDASLERCYLIDEAMAKLARVNPDIKFLRAKASALGFATSAPAPKPQPLKPKLRQLREEDEEDPYADDDDDDDEESTSEDDENVDLDMLPTVLVYRAGDLIHNWVRVDWESGGSGFEELLDKHHILSKRTNYMGAPTGDDDEAGDLYFLWSDSDDELGKQPGSL